jgi:hypothetical protein
MRPGGPMRHAAPCGPCDPMPTTPCIPVPVLVLITPCGPKGGAEPPLPALRRQAPRGVVGQWVRGWVGGRGPRRTPDPSAPPSAPFAKKSGFQPRREAAFAPKPTALQPVTEARCSRGASELPIMGAAVRGGRLGVVWSPPALVASTEAT